MQEINLYDLLKYYARNWLILLSAAFAGAIIGLVYTFFIQTPLYKSNATMLVIGASTSQDTTINNNYTELFKSRRVLDTVIKDKGYQGDYTQLVGRTTVSNDKDTDVIRVSIADPSAQKSEQLLSASLDSFRAEAKALYGSDNIKVVDTASLPTAAYNVNTKLQVAVALVASTLAVVVILFFVFDYRSSQALVVVEPAAAAKKPKQANKSNANKKAKSQKAAPVSKKPSTVVSGMRSFRNYLVAPLQKLPKHQ